MNKTILAITVTLTALIFAGFTAFGAPISCRGQIPGGESIGLTANWTSTNELQDVTLYHATDSPAKYGTVTANAKYRPRAKEYQGLNQFSLGGDGWMTAYILFPKTRPETSEFVAYYVTGGEASEGSARLLCKH